jgi:hypothetical protein
LIPRGEAEQSGLPPNSISSFIDLGNVLDFRSVLLYGTDAMIEWNCARCSSRFSAAQRRVVALPPPAP